MNERTRYNCEQLLNNRERIKTVFGWDGSMMQLCCAGIYSARGLSVDESMLMISKQMIKERVGVFSEFRSTARPAIAAMIATSENPGQTLENGLLVYDLLKKEFWGSAYLPLAAMIIAQRAEADQYEQIAKRTRVIYDKMKVEHPFLTSSEDSAFCALLALSEKSDEQLITEMEECYQTLKPHFFSSNAVQSLSEVLALCEGTVAEKCERTMELFNRLKEAGHKYGTDYELPTLGVLAMCGADLESAAEEMVKIDDWLAEQKGFGFFGGISRKQRLMYAGVLAQKEYVNENAMEAAAVGSTVALVIAQEVAMCAAVAASAAAAAAASSSSS